MQSTYNPNQMTNSFRPQNSQIPPTQQPQVVNPQVVGTQSTYPTTGQFQFQHEQDPNFRSNSYILKKEQPMQASVVAVNQPDAVLRSHSYIPQQQNNLMKSSIVMDPKDKPLHTLQEFEFNKQQVRQPIPIIQPQPTIVTTYPERIPTQSYRIQEPKKRDEYCGLFTNSKPEGYSRGKITQEDNEEKKNDYWLCKIF